MPCVLNTLKVSSLNVEEVRLQVHDSERGAVQGVAIDAPHWSTKPLGPGAAAGHLEVYGSEVCQCEHRTSDTYSLLSGMRVSIACACMASNALLFLSKRKRALRPQVSVRKSAAQRKLQHCGHLPRQMGLQ